MIRLKANGAILDEVDEIAINPAHISVVALSGKVVRIGMIGADGGIDDTLDFDTELQARMMFDKLVSV